MSIKDVIHHIEWLLYHGWNIEHSWEFFEVLHNGSDNLYSFLSTDEHKNEIWVLCYFNENKNVLLFCYKKVRWKEQEQENTHTHTHTYTKGNDKTKLTSLWSPVVWQIRCGGLSMFIVFEVTSPVSDRFFPPGRHPLNLWWTWASLPGANSMISTSTTTTADA